MQTITMSSKVEASDAQHLSQLSTQCAAQVSDAFCSDDQLDMSLLSVRKLTARSVEQGKIAKRVNLVSVQSCCNFF